MKNKKASHTGPRPAFDGKCVTRLKHFFTLLVALMSPLYKEGIAGEFS